MHTDPAHPAALVDRYIAGWNETDDTESVDDHVRSARRLGPAGATA